MSNEHLVERFDHKGYTISIYYDEDGPNPRTDWDNFGRMVCWHNRYNLGDCEHTKRAFKKPCHTDHTVFDSPGDFKSWWDEHGKDGIILPLYLYDHSGITISTGRFSCPWDSGQVGYIYATKDMILKEFKELTPETVEKATSVLEGEVKVYDDYITGQVYGYIVTDEGDNEIGSCWGFVGDLDYVRSEAPSVAEHAASKPNYSI